MPRRRGKRLGTAIIAVPVAIALAIGGYAALHRTKPNLIGPGCEIWVSGQSIALDPEQAALAGTIAGVGYRRGLPEKAVTVAYATAMQESHLHNPDYGDRDSVGVFQQRPSQGWGSARDLEDPVYAANKFFDVLVHVHGYQRMPVHTAAQEVQHSADGAAYQQYETFAAALSGAFTGQAAHAVWCWYQPSAKIAANLPEAERELSRTFGPLGVGLAGHDPAAQTARTVSVRVVSPAAGWSAAAWAVAHAQDYGIRTVRYAGYQWQAASGNSGWQHVTGGASAAPANRVELS